MSKNENKESISFAFEKMNYIYMVGGLLLIVAGLMLLSGGGSEDPKIFNPEIFNFRRMVLAPVVMLAGFILEIYAIMYRPKKAE